MANGVLTTSASLAPGAADALPLVRTEQLWRTFSFAQGEIEVLKNLDFELNPGETVAVVGPSGIGKSTLLQVIGTLERPSAGKVWFQDQDVFEMQNAELAAFRNRQIGFVFQFHHLLPEFTAIENAMMPAYIGGQPRANALASAEEILVRVGLAERLHQRVSKLSGGEQQRVALARALVCKPALLLADEPTGNLDEANSERVHALLMTLNQEMGMTMLTVTHNAVLASYMSRRVSLRDGRIVEMD
jgi:lipoprotein-releasing system ATP-binding protein